MKNLFLLPLIFLCSCQDPANTETEKSVANGQMPSLATDDHNIVHLVYGSGDSILYASSSDRGTTFSTPSLVAVLPDLAASHTRGPQIATTSEGLVLTACTSGGDIFSFVKYGSGNWQASGKVNDADTVAKENLMGLAADGFNTFAVWLDLRNRHNQIFGARSTDGGRTWSKNIPIYVSPDSTVCECCKPSVAMKGAQVRVMFRNWLDGNRDMYVIRSDDGGLTFGEAQKLGTGSWPLKACPMDGGRVVMDKDNKTQTVWNRKGSIYASEPGAQENKIGEGKSCTMETVNGRNVYCWVENGEIVFLNPEKQKRILGKGIQPVLTAVDDAHVLCVWEADKQIHRQVVEL